MIKKEFDTLIKRIRDMYSSFNVDEDEWFKVLGEYSYDDVSNNLQNYSKDIPPLYTHLIKGLKKEIKQAPLHIQCDLCGELVLVDDDWGVYEKHHRKCEKIDFIDRQSKRINKTGITKSIYYKMSDEELEKNYRPYMNRWIKDNPDIAYHPELLFKKI